MPSEAPVLVGETMLTQVQANALISLSKHLVTTGEIRFPAAGDYLQLEARSDDEHESFLIDVNRRGKIKLTKCTYQERYATVEILMRLDVDGPPHENPDGTVVPCPHLHEYREGFGVKWARPLPASFSNASDLVVTFRDFLKFCNVGKIPPIQKLI
jgi:MoaA/NifB/PqqE/SkfB family radical SAM enzyme